MLTRGKTPRKRLRTPPDLLKGRHVETPSQCCEKAGLLTTRANLYSPCPTLLTDVVGAAASSTCMRVLMTSIGVVGTAATAAAAAATTMEVSGRREGLGAVVADCDARFEALKEHPVEAGEGHVAGD